MKKSEDINILERIVDKLNELQASTHKIDKEVALQQQAFADHLSHHERLLEEQARATDILQENTDSLKEHMRRTELLEELVAKMDARLSPIEKEKIEKDAIKAHNHAMLIKWGKIFGAITAVAGAVVSAVTWAKPFLLWLLTL